MELLINHYLKLMILVILSNIKDTIKDFTDKQMIVIKK